MSVTEHYGILPFELKPSQDEFLRSFSEGKGHYCLIGEAGSGKSTIMEVLRSYYGHRMATYASTGVANQNLYNSTGGDGTAHRGMSLFIGIHTKDELGSVNPVTQKLLGGSDLIEVIVIEEAFMLSPDDLFVLLHRLKRFNKATSKRKLRNIRLLFIGDCLQLPAVVTDIKQELIEMYGSHLLFKTTPWKEAGFTTMKLREANRQQDKVFLAALDVLRYGQEERYDGVLAWLNKRYNPDYDQSSLLLAATNRTVDEANHKALTSTGNPVGCYTAVKTGKFKVRDCPVDEKLYLSVGLDVITLVNDKEGNFCNGSFGKVTCMQENGVWIRFHGELSDTFVGIHRFVESETSIGEVTQDDGSVQEEKIKKDVGSFKQIPVKIAASLTFYRSQGRTINKQGVIDVGNKWLYTNKRMEDFGTHGLYVALSRFTDINLVTFATKLEKHHIKVCRESIDWWNSID